MLAFPQLIMRSTNPRDVAYIFRDYARKIHSKAVPGDPSFLQISVACGKVRRSRVSAPGMCWINTARYPQIEQWCEHYYPSFVSVSKSASGNAQQVFDPTDARTQIVQLAEKRDRQLAIEKRMGNGAAKEAARPLGESPSDTREILLYVGAAFVVIFLIGIGAAWLLMQFFE